MQYIALLCTTLHYLALNFTTLHYISLFFTSFDLITIQVTQLPLYPEKTEAEEEEGGLWACIRSVNGVIALNTIYTELKKNYIKCLCRNVLISFFLQSLSTKMVS